MEEVAKAMGADSWQSAFKDKGAMFEVRPYQTTHNTGHHIMPEIPDEGFQPPQSGLGHA